MSWLSDFVNNIFGGGGEDPNAVASRNAAEYQKQQQAMQAEWDRRMQAQRDADEQRYGTLMNQLLALTQQRQAPVPPTPEEQARTQREEQALARQRELETLRSGALSGVNALFTPGFETARVAGELDDPFIEDIYGRERGKAEDYLNNLLARGIVTETGAGAARGNIEEQGGRVRQQLRDIGDLLISGQREKLGQIAGRGREAASTLELGQAFDPSIYGSEAEKSLAEFTKNLGDLFTSRLPSGDLFDVGGLSSIAGAAQKAQNLPFEPQVPYAEKPEGEKSEEEKKRTSTVF